MKLNDKLVPIIVVVLGVILVVVGIVVITNSTNKVDVYPYEENVNVYDEVDVYEEDEVEVYTEEEKVTDLGFRFTRESLKDGKKIKKGKKIFHKAILL